jgi:hypothetical protein
VSSASTSAAGVVQLYDGLNSTSTTQALTANQGYLLQQQINAVALSSNITLAGTIDASTGLLLTVTDEGITAGFTVGNVLPAAAAGNDNFFVIVTTQGTMTPPGGSARFCHVGDWWLSNGLVWQFIDAGNQPGNASTTSAGIVQLATTAQTQTGTSGSLAITPSGAAATYIPLSCLTAKGAIISATSPSTASALPVGANGQVLFACSLASTGLCWATPSFGTLTSVTAGTGLSGGTITSSGTISIPTSGVTAGTYTNSTFTVNSLGIVTSALSGAAAIPCSCIVSKGSIITGTAASTPVALPVGVNGQVLTANSVSSSGLCWTTPCSGTVTSVTAGTGLSGGTITGTGTICIPTSGVTAGSYTNANITVNAQGIVTAATSGAGGSGIPCACITAKGSLVTGTAASTPVALPVGTDGQFLAACSTATSGLCWVSASLGPATPTTLGTVYACTSIAGGGVTYLGLCAGCNTQTSNNIAIGYFAMADASGSAANIAIGNSTLQCANQGPQLAIGHSALCRNSGFANTFVGYLSGLSATTTCNSTALGYLALSGLTTGLNNTALGSEAGRSLSTGTGNVFVGTLAGCTLTTGNNNIVIGNGANAATTTVSNTVTLGNSAVTTIRAAVTTITAISDARDKTDIVTLPVGLDFVNSLNPVKFTWQQREPNEVKDGTSEAGFIAQELQAAESQYSADYLGLVYDENPEQLEASPGKLIPVLVKAIQELSAKVAELEEKLASNG